MRRLVLIALLSVVACKEKATPPPEEKAFQPRKDYVPGSIDDSQKDDSVRPVYPTMNVKIDPLAERFCEAIHGLPRKRFAECCSRTLGVMLTSECARNLSGAMVTSAVKLTEAAVAGCEAAMAKAHEGCEWVGPWPPGMPAECAGIFEGTVDEKGKCRSSIECKNGLRCLGVGPTDPGVCGPPPETGKLCGTAVDTLAVYLRQDDYELQHPSCVGYCDRNRCTATLAIGGACKANAECGRENRCSKGKCVAGAKAAEGDACLGGDCSAGLRCVQNKCVAPKAIGAACAADQECRAGCTDGKCAQRCDTMPVIPKGKNAPVIQQATPQAPGPPK